jgi:hypothetical protein
LGQPHPQYQALWREQERLAAPAITEIGIAMPDPRHMDPTQAFVGWPAVALHLSRRLRLDPPAATVDLPTLLVFTAPALPNQLDATGIARLLSELQRCGEATVEELLQITESSGAQRRAASDTLAAMGLVKAV